MAAAGAGGAAVAPPPPLPNVPIELLTNSNRRTVQRYGVVKHPYIRRITGGPYVILRVRTFEGNREFNLVDATNLFNPDGSPVRLNTLEPDEIVNLEDLALWTEDMHIGDVDPAYPIIVATEGRFRPGAHVIGKPSYPWNPDIQMTVMEGPYLIRNNQGRAVIAYYCKVPDAGFPAGYMITMKEESELREDPEYHAARMALSENLYKRANRLAGIKSAISSKLGEERQIVASSEGAAAGAGGASVNAFSGARGTAMVSTKKKNLPRHVTNLIAKFAYGNAAYINTIRRDAQLYGDPHVVHGLPLTRRGGKRRRQTRRRR